MGDKVNITEDAEVASKNKRPILKHDLVAQGIVSPEENAVLSCLRNETITVKYVIRQSDYIRDKRHVLYGGLAENAHITLTVPMLSTGMFANVLTNDEKTFIENYLGLPENALSVYKKENNFWAEYYVKLGKEDSYLNLADPYDYIKYKVLLANKNIVCPNPTELRDAPKRTYRFYLVSDNEEMQSQLSFMSASMEASMLLGSLMGDKEVMKYIVEVLSGKGVSKTAKLDFILSQAYQLMQEQTKTFIAVAKDPYLKTKAFISKCVDSGLIRRRDNLFFLSANNAPLSKDTSDPTLNNAAKYLNDGANQEIKLLLEAKLKAKEE